MEVVLGLSMSSHVARLALVEGADGRGRMLEHDEFPVNNPVNHVGGVGSPGISEHVVSIILGTSALAAAQGYRLLKVGITWTEDLDTEAWLVTDSLRGLGIQNVVSVPMIDAVEAFVHTLADANDDRTAAALVLESESATATTVSAGCDGNLRVVTQIYRGQFSSDDSLRSHATSIFANMDSESTTVAVVGSRTDQDWLAEQLSDLTSLSVTVPDECELALARGAAIVAAHADTDRLVPHPPPRGAAKSCIATAPVQGQPKSLLFVPRTARLTTLDEVARPEAQTAELTETPRRTRGAAATTRLLTAMLIMVSFTLLVSLVILTNESADARSAQPSAVSQSPVALPSPPVRADPGESPTVQRNSTQTTEVFAIPGLKSFSPSMAVPMPASPPTPPAARPAVPAPAPTAVSPRAVPEALAPYVPFFNGMLAVLQGGLPASAPPAGTDPLVIAVPQPLMEAIPDTTHVSIPDLDLSVLANLSSPH